MTDLADILYQLKITDQKLTQLFEHQLGISLTRYEILRQLLDMAPCSQVDLQERLQIDQAAITRHLRTLELESYITRKRNPDNQRQVLVNVTEKAIRELQTDSPAQHIAVKEQMADVLSETERHTLSTLLDKLVDGLENITL